MDGASRRCSEMTSFLSREILDSLLLHRLSRQRGREAECGPETAVLVPGLQRWHPPGRVAVRITAKRWRASGSQPDTGAH